VYQVREESLVYGECDGNFGPDSDSDLNGKEAQTTSRFLKSYVMNGDGNEC